MTRVTCIMPTADRRRFVPAAIRLFLAQDYPNKELIILDDGSDSVEDIIPTHPQICYLRSNDRRSIGSKRNAACAVASGQIILHWDDDDWYASWRVRYQVEMLESGDFDICGISRAFFVDTASHEAWEYVYPRSTRPWVCGATLCYRKSLWERHRFADIKVGEDTRFILSAHGARIGVLDDNRFFLGRIHESNTSPKRLKGDRWKSRPMETMRSVAGSQWVTFFGGVGGS